MLKISTKIKIGIVLLIILLFSPSVISMAKNIDTRDNISLWIGDSRTVLIYQDLNMKSKKGVKYRSKTKIERFQGRNYLMLKYRNCYAARGIGYNFFKSALPKIKQTVKRKGTQNIVLASSVNDLYNAQLNPFSHNGIAASPEKMAKEYWKLYKENLIKKYPNDYFYLVSINPVYCTLHYRGNVVTNDMVVRFNKKLKSLIAKSSFGNVSYVDTYKNIFKKQRLIHKKSAYRYDLKYRTTNVRYMRESSSYQLHYSDKVDKKIYKYVNGFIDKT